MIRRTIVAAAAAMIATLSTAADATGLANRVWVSGHGVDAAGCGAPTDPCRSLQYAHDNAVVAGGEIDILDPAGYGAITITKAISIVNDGVGTAGVQATSGSAILINAGATDAVYLRGLNIDGVGRQGAIGVFFGAGASLTVVNCVVRNFSQDGVLMAPTTAVSKMTVSDTLVTDEPVGLEYSGSGAVVDRVSINRVTADNNNTAGFKISGGSGTGSTTASIAGSSADNNDLYGVELEQINAFGLSVDLVNDHFANNSQDGVLTIGLPTVDLSNSVLRANGLFGVGEQPADANVFSYGDNLFQGNGEGPCCDVAGLLTSASLK